MGQKKPTKQARILIVDDHPAVRQALALRLNRQPHFLICGEAADADEALRLIADTGPDVAVVDVSLLTCNGIDLVKQITDMNDHICILVWSMHSELIYAERALRAGALGFITKDHATDHIVEAIRTLLAGNVWLSEALAERMFQRTASSARGELLQALSGREFEVFRMIGAGIRTTAIAQRLGVTVKTLETYERRIQRKLNLADKAKLAHFAVRWVLA
jgi:DNA-binding NarL/FixJ family response regulator